MLKLLGSYKLYVNMKKGKLQWLVSITQILSSLAVLVSIIYLITEYNRSGLLNRVAIENRVYERVMTLNQLLVEHPELAEIVVKAQTNSDSLTTTETIRYLAYEHIFYDSWETLWVGNKDGLVEDEVWNEWNDWFLLKASEKPALSLEGNKENITEEFFNLIKNELANE